MNLDEMKNMLEEKLPIDTIMRLTGLSKKEIEDLK